MLWLDFEVLVGVEVEREDGIFVSVVCIIVGVVCLVYGIIGME